MSGPPDAGDELAARLWAFVRGDLAASAFEAWALSRPDLEAWLGGELWLELLSADLADRETAWRLRERLAVHARALPGPSCPCLRLRDRETVGAGTFSGPAPAFEEDRPAQDVLGTLVDVRRRGRPWWWLRAARCDSCGQGWLVGEESQNDGVHLRRLDAVELAAIERDDRWPDDFDLYEGLLGIDPALGRSARFLLPEDERLAVALEALARAHPGIGVTELASRLAIERDLAARLARFVARAEWVEIALESR